MKKIILSAVLFLSLSVNAFGFFDLLTPAKVIDTIQLGMNSVTVYKADKKNGYYLIYMQGNQVIYANFTKTNKENNVNGQ